MDKAFAAGWDRALGELEKVLLDVHGAGPGRLMGIQLWGEIRDHLASLKTGGSDNSEALQKAHAAHVPQSETLSPVLTYDEWRRKLREDAPIRNDDF